VNPLDSISFFIPTCSKYLVLAQVLVPKLAQLSDFLPYNISIYVSTDEPDVYGDTNDLTRITLLHGSSSKIDWTSLAVSHLRKINTEYVLLWLDDLIPSSNCCNTLSLQDLLGAMQLYDLDYIRLVTFFNKTASKNGFDYYIESLSAFLLARNSFVYQFPFSKPYSFSLMPAIWKRSSLLKILENNLGCSPWQLETSIQIPPDFRPRFAAVTRSVVGIQNLVIKGSLWPPSASKVNPPPSVLARFNLLQGYKRLLFSLNLIKHRLYLIFLYLPSLLGETFPVDVMPK